MKQTGRRGYSTAQRAEIWRRWHEGESVSAIARALCKYGGSIQGVLASNGGIVPAQRRRSRLALTLAEREDISRGIAAGLPVRRIAETIGRSPSSVSREINRNGGRKGYRAVVADGAAWDRSRRPKRCRLSLHAPLRQAVAAKLAAKWSPEQIAGWLKVAYPYDERMRASHETIYRSLFIQTRGVLKQELTKCLRSHRKIRRSKNASTEGQARGQIVDGLSIRERPAEVEDRAIPGHWEGDLLAGTKNSHIATLVERWSRFVLLVKVEGKDTQSVVSALIRQVRTLPDQLKRTLTWDRGMELAHHKRFTVATDVQVYFCDPQSPWQRGSNENTNGLLRQYFPKGRPLSGYTQADLDAVALELNQRPRKTLGFMTPQEKLEEALR